MPTAAYGILTARDSFNIGDEIQSIAVEKLLPRVDERIDRMDLASYQSRVRTLLVMNGWFAPRGMDWPPSDAILPVFYGFHATEELNWRGTMASPRLKAYYEQYAPIGCRDNATREAFQLIGIEATTTWCASLTLERREREPTGRVGKVFLVDADHVPVPRSIAKRAIRIGHRIDPSLDPTGKRSRAEELLDKYRSEARLVVTTKLHCAMPCAAMGIPTIFIGDSANTRYEPVQQVLPINDFVHKEQRIARRLHRSSLNRRFIANVDWDPPAPEFEELKRAMTGMFEAKLDAAMGLQHPDPYLR